MLTEIAARFKQIFERHKTNELSKEGNDAYYAGIAPDHCPYAEGSQESEDWISGYFKGFAIENRTPNLHI